MNFKNIIFFVNVLLFICSIFILFFQIIEHHQFNLTYGDDFFIIGLILLNALMIIFLKKEWKVVSMLLIFFNSLVIVVAIFLLIGWTFVIAFDDSDKIPHYTEILTFLLIIPSSFLSSVYFLTSFSKKENPQKIFNVKDIFKNILKVLTLIFGIIIGYILLVIIFTNLL